MTKKAVEVIWDNVVLRVEGIFIYKDFKAGEESLKAFWEDYYNQTLCFDDCIGTYRIQIDLHDRGQLFFGDSAGVMFWYLDDMRGRILGQLSDVLLTEREPDYASIAQFLWFGCIYEGGTILKGVVRSDPECFYTIRDGKITAYSKNLTPFEKLPDEDNALEQYVRRVLNAVEAREHIGCTITGGTDSRAILAHLCSLGIKPLLSITGTDEQSDVKIAKQIAATLGQKIITVSGKPETSEWLEATLIETDGQAGACGAYRLLRQFQTLEKQDVVLQFGGVAGEFYKNSFINQDYPNYSGRPNWKRFLKYKVITYDFPESLCGPKLRDEVKRVPVFLLSVVEKNQGKTKASAYLSAGYRILQARTQTISMMENRHVITCNPLLERCVAAPMFRTDPYKLEMQSYQRWQVTQLCPQIKNIPTDRGLTCNSGRKQVEWLKSAAFLARVAFGRLFHRKKTAGRIDPCFEQGLCSLQYSEAVDQCKKLGILSEAISPGDLPRSIADRVLTVGNFFKSNE